MLNEIEISYNPTKLKVQKIHKSSDAVKIFRQLWNSEMQYRECAYMLLLNRANETLAIRQISSGMISGTLMPIGQTYGIALKANASGIIIAHNHPSGNLKASNQDISVANRMIEAGKLLEVECLDFLIITSEGYTSFRDEGLVQVTANLGEGKPSYFLTLKFIEMKNVKEVKFVKIVDDAVQLDCDGNLYWMDVWEENGEILVDWNQYIFFLNNSIDIKRKKFQENSYNFDVCSSIAVENYINNLKNH